MYNSKLNTQHSELLIIVLAYLALATLYSVIVPLGEGPDEPGHAAYAFFLAREGRLPVQRADPSQSDVPGEGHQPPLAYLLASVAVRWLPPNEQVLDVIGNPRFVWAGGDEPNALAHGSRASWPWRGSTLAWHLARLVSVGLGAVTVVCTYLIARQLDLRFTIYDLRLRNAEIVHRPLLAAALVAFNPQFLFTSALVTNDALLVALSAVLLLLVTRADERRTTNDERRTRIENKYPSSIVYRLSSAVRPLAIGVVLGLALITKQNALLLIPIALIGMLRHWSHGLQRGRYKRLLVSLSPYLIVIAIAGWWYTRNLQLYGDLLGLTAFQAEFATQPFVVGSVTAWVAALRQLHESFWSRFGWMNVAAPLWVIIIYSAIEIVALTGLAKWLLERRGNEQWSFVIRHLSFVILLPLLAFIWIVSFALTAGLVAWQGRLLFPALPAIAVLLAWGLTAWENKEQRTKNKHIRTVPLFFTLCSLFLIALWLPFGVIRPAYPNYALPEQTALAQLGRPISMRFANKGEPGVELRGWQVTGDARPGGALEVTLTWHALARQSRDWSVFIHLVDEQDNVVSSVDAPPKNDAFPMTQWRAGDWVQGRCTLPLPSDLAPSSYTLQIGLFDEQGSGRRTGVFDQAGDLRGDALDLTQVTVNP